MYLVTDCPCTSAENILLRKCVHVSTGILLYSAVLDCWHGWLVASSTVSPASSRVPTVSLNHPLSDRVDKIVYAICEIHVDLSIVCMQQQQPLTPHGFSDGQIDTDGLYG